MVLKKTQMCIFFFQNYFYWRMPGHPKALLGSDESLNRIYINENLTTFRRDLLSKALKKRKDKILSSVWTLDGKIFAKTSSDEEPIKIQSEADLNNICAEI